MNLPKLSLLMLPVCLLALSACGGSRENSANRPEKSGPIEQAHTAPILIFTWTGGVAGFQRSLELYTDGQARAGDKVMESSGRMQMETKVLTSFIDSVSAVVKPANGPFNSKAFDDFHFVIDFHPDKDRGNIHVEGDGSAFPENYQPILRRLMEWTYQALENAKK
ncbi:MAG: hypothetical protein KJ970_05700 [Candidatus Eisenbacteria bacterium]|uniref:Lipoprotein n=1 Tax=Eiseniibacteriota bacterium TaxID=2212470 RepID=A0A948RVM6_UNCEI|nr:hypothetical protein [Candidatus Eisenbacteria bacterium]MBU1950092.1 hypothetical protein [Candidatus Eisenbacteria bacterium]MBU2690403.1 hypothetical protein [Candidatus Eisenbacteria bacterium]